MFTSQKTLPNPPNPCCQVLWEAWKSDPYPYIKKDTYDCAISCIHFSSKAFQSFGPALFSRILDNPGEPSASWWNWNKWILHITLLTTQLKAIRSFVDFFLKLSSFLDFSDIISRAAPKECNEFEVTSDSKCCQLQI